MQALQKSRLNLPLVVRLAGTNVEEGRRILNESGLPIIRAATLCRGGRPRRLRLAQRRAKGLAS